MTTRHFGARGHEGSAVKVLVRHPSANARDVVAAEELNRRFLWPGPDGRRGPCIDGVRGCVAVTRGPEVYGLESIDLPTGISDVADVIVDSSVPPFEEEGEVLVTIRRRSFRHACLAADRVSDEDRIRESWSSRRMWVWT
ncbi:hypothetical protein [Herbiconiux ginsengi]|uniref:hypothetical protein n=1 Tax=Herbiconiux ginsengi TaxID=381665 RepID=UPI00389966A9